MSDAGKMLPDEGQAEAWVCPQGHLHILFTWKASKEKMMAETIKTGNARIPQPSDDLFKRLAKAGFECLNVLRKDDGLDYQEDYTDRDQDHWYLTVKAIYGIIAKAGGAKARPIRERTS